MLKQFFRYLRERVGPTENGSWLKWSARVIVLSVPLSAATLMMEVGLFPICTMLFYAITAEPIHPDNPVGYSAHLDRWHRMSTSAFEKLGAYLVAISLVVGLGLAIWLGEDGC